MGMLGAEREFGDGHAKEGVHDQGRDWLDIGEQSHKAVSGSWEHGLQPNSLGFATEADGATTSNNLPLASDFNSSLAVAAAAEIQSLDFGSEKSHAFEHRFGEAAGCNEASAQEVFAAHPEVTLDEAILHFK
jgi:hypothetical protein